MDVGALDMRENTFCVPSWKQGFSGVKYQGFLVWKNQNTIVQDDFLNY